MDYYRLGKKAGEAHKGNQSAIVAKWRAARDESIALYVDGMYPARADEYRKQSLAEFSRGFGDA